MELLKRLLELQGLLKAVSNDSPEWAQMMRDVNRACVSARNLLQQDEAHRYQAAGPSLFDLTPVEQAEERAEQFHKLIEREPMPLPTCLLPEEKREKVRIMTEQWSAEDAEEEESA